MFFCLPKIITHKKPTKNGELLSVRDFFWRRSQKYIFMKNDFKKRECISKGITFYQKSKKFHHKQKKKYKRDKNIIKCRSKQQVSIKLSLPIKNKKHIRRVLQ